MTTVKPRGGSQRLFLTRVETMENGICIITQIVYVIVTFKLIISNFSSGYIAHLAHLQVLNARIYDGVLFISKLINISTQELP